MYRHLIFLGIFLGIVFSAEASWRANYEQGLQLQAQGQYEKALDFLKMSAADKPISEIIGDGQETLEYLPYLQIGICYYHLGKVQLAGEFFDLENSLAAISKSKSGQTLLREYRTKVSSSGEDKALVENSIKDFKKKGYLLSGSEVQRLKEEVRQRCKLPVADERNYPWYYHYELGLAMEHRNDWQRALDSFINALDDRDQPKKFSRIYGMWYVDYYPYYNIGLAHYHLQNWECAANSFKLSQMLEDLPKDSAEYRLLEKYKGEIAKNLADSSSNE